MTLYIRGSCSIALRHLLGVLCPINLLIRKSILVVVLHLVLRTRSTIEPAPRCNSTLSTCLYIDPGRSSHTAYDHGLRIFFGHLIQLTGLLLLLLVVKLNCRRLLFLLLVVVILIEHLHEIHILLLVIEARKHIVLRLVVADL